MKRNYFCLVLVMLFSMTGLKAHAEDYDFSVVNADGVTIYYNYINDGQEVAVTCKYSSAFYSSDYKDRVVIPEEVTYNDKTLKVTAIADHAFAATWVKSVVLPNTVTTIGESAFENCGYLSTITLPASVISIERYAFENTDLSEVVSYIENPFAIKGKEYDSRSFSVGTFDNAIVYVPAGTTDKYKETDGWKDFAHFKEGTPTGRDIEISGLYYNLDMEAKTAEVTFGPNCYEGDVVIPSSVTYNDETYSVTGIGHSAFASCFDLTSISIPSSLTTIGLYAFSATALTSIAIPEGVTTIGGHAFEYCNSLTEISIPHSVTSIGTYAFFNPQIETVKINNETPLSNVGYNAFEYRDKITLYVPVGSKEAYATHNFWYAFKEIIETDNFDTGIREVRNEEVKSDKCVYGIYTLDGRRLNGKPTQTGVYIVNGKKTVIK